MSHSFKLLLSIAILLAIITGMGLISQNILSISATGLEKELSQVESSTVSNDWKTARTSLDKVSNKWTGLKGIWAVLIDHIEIDNIDIALSRLDKYILCKDTSSALAEASAMMKYIRHIPRKEAFKIENVF